MTSHLLEILDTTSLYKVDFTNKKVFVSKNSFPKLIRPYGERWLHHSARRFFFFFLIRLLLGMQWPTTWSFSVSKGALNKSRNWRRVTLTYCKIFICLKSVTHSNQNWAKDAHKKVLLKLLASNHNYELGLQPWTNLKSLKQDERKLHVAPDSDLGWIVCIQGVLYLIRRYFISSKKSVWISSRRGQQCNYLNIIFRVILELKGMAMCGW